MQYTSLLQIIALLVILDEFAGRPVGVHVARPYGVPKLIHCVLITIQWA
ncbi:MAG: hypothetical protein ACJATP_002562 [Candidatus Azotimanducaceae bacterium]|jgi:hypothetical protein